MKNRPLAHDQHHRRIARAATTQDERSLREVIDRAKRYTEDQIWLSPVELKETIRRLADSLEAHLDDPVATVLKVDDAPVATLQAPAMNIPEATHRGTVLGLKGREDYEAELALVEDAVWQDQHGRRFNAGDYGYEAEEAYRLDLGSLHATNT